MVFYCRSTSASTAPCTSRRMCCPAHCASYCQKLLTYARSFWLSFCPQSRTTSPFLGPGFVLALAGIRRLVVQINAIENDDLIPFCGRLKSPPEFRMPLPKRQQLSKKIFHPKAKAIIWLMCSLFARKRSPRPHTLSRGRKVPLPSEKRTNKTVNARLWPWLKKKT